MSPFYLLLFDERTISIANNTLGHQPALVRILQLPSKLDNFTGQIQIKCHSYYENFLPYDTKR